VRVFAHSDARRAPYIRQLTEAAVAADAVMGKVNPAGKLTLTWYPQSFTEQVKISDYGMRPNTATGNPGRTYRFYTGD
jgi:beta-D-xylosidase 4